MVGNEFSGIGLSFIKLVLEYPGYNYNYQFVLVLALLCVLYAVRFMVSNLYSLTIGYAV